MLAALSILAQVGAPSLGVPAILLIVWPILACVIVRTTTPARGMIAAYLIGWMFLPMAAVNTPFVTYDKFFAVSVGALLGTALADSTSMLALRPRWVDLPMLAWLLVVPMSAASNGNSFYDTAAAFTRQLCVWGIPYLLGRAYLTRWSDARDLAVALFIGGLVYAPLCLLEVRLSPFLHYTVYRFWPNAGFFQSFRDGGWRPMVFMQHGLAVGTFMASATLCGWWLWWTGALRDVFRLPVLLPLICLLATTILVKSTGATALLILGVIVMYATGRTRLRVFLLILLLLPTVYVLTRTVGGSTGNTFVSIAAKIFGQDRAESLQFRFDNEVAYIDHTRAKPLLGYGPGYTFMLMQDGTSLVCDSLWIISLAVNGLIGLFALLALFAAPVAVLLYRVPARHLAHPAFAGATALAILTLLYAIDNLANAMFSPMFVVALGSLGALTSAPLVVAPLARSPFRRQVPPAATRPLAIPAPVHASNNGDIDPAFLAPGIISLEEKPQASHPGV